MNREQGFVASVVCCSARFVWAALRKTDEAVADRGMKSGSTEREVPFVNQQGSSGTGFLVVWFLVERADAGEWEVI